MFAIFLIPVLGFAEDVEIPSVLREALAARQAIVSGEIEYEICDAKLSERPGTKWECTQLHFKDRLVFDTRQGFKAYLERWTPVKPSYVNPSGEVVTPIEETPGSLERFIIRPDRIYEWRPEALSTGEHLGIIEDVPQEGLFEMRAVLHPWKFGLMPEPADDYWRTDLKAYIIPTDALEFQTAEVVLEGSRCWRAEYRRENGWIGRVWCDREKGMNITRVEVEGNNGFYDFQLYVASTLREYPDAGVWFPTDVILGGGNGDDAGALVDRIHVTNARFNIPIDEEQFTVQALNPVPKTGIVRRYENDRPREEWDGNQVAPVALSPQPDFDIEPIDAPTPANSTRLVLLLVGNLLLIGVLMIWVILRRRNRTRT